MERGMERSRRPGVLVWTPAPGPTSPPCPVGSQRGWVEGEDEDFHNHMDENGIIGLTERPGGMGEEESFGVEEEDLLWHVGTPEPEDGPPCAMDILGCHLSELLESEPPSQSTGDGCPSHNEGNDSFAFRNWSDDDNGQNLYDKDRDSLRIYSTQPDSRPNRPRVPAIASDEDSLHGEQSLSVQGGMNPQYDGKESQDGDGCGTELQSLMADGTTDAPSQRGCDDLRVSSEQSSASSPLSAAGAPHARVHSCLPQPSSEEHASEAEPRSGPFCHAFRPYQPVRPDEEQPEVDATPLSTPSRRGSKTQPGRSSPGNEASAELERQVLGPRRRHQQPSLPSAQSVLSTQRQAQQRGAHGRSSSTDDSRRGRHQNMRHHSHRAPKTSPTLLKDVRRGQLSHPPPDFSKVEPRVRLPKTSYKPPTSGKPPRRRSSKSEAPLVIKSPADIVREVLLSSTEGLSDASAPPGSQGPLNSTLPEEFRCPLKASALVLQLQEDYNRLLTKYAEAENTIDRLRLEAKVNLYSEPPKSSCAALSGVLQEGSKVMTLSFPQAQRVELSMNTIQPTQTFSSESIRGTPTHPPVDSSSSRQTESLTGTQRLEGLTKQTQSFQLQIDEFEELLKNGRLAPHERTEGLTSLAQTLDCVERAYLASRDHDLQLQKTGGASSTFDSDRELEGMIFHSGMRLEELREWVGQTEQDRPTSEPAPSPPRHALQLSWSLKETEPQPKDPTPSVHAGVMVMVEGSSLSGQSDGDGEEMLPSLFPPLPHTQQPVEEEFTRLMDRTDGVRNELQWKTNDQQQETSEALRRMPDSPSGLSHSTQVLNSTETLPASVLPGQQTTGGRFVGSRKSCTTLGETATVETRSPKECTRMLGTAPLDGIRSPETDSGFVGSDSSRVTPATCSPVQKRAVMRHPDPGSPVHTRASSGRSAHCPGPVGTAPDSTEGRGEAVGWHLPSASPSSAPRRWPGSSFQPWASSSISGAGLEQPWASSGISGAGLEQPWASSGISGAGLEQPWASNGVSGARHQSGSERALLEEEAQQGDRRTKPTNWDASFLRSSSPTLTYHGGNYLTPKISAQLTNRQEAIQSLQMEVDRLRERLEGTLRTAGPVRSFEGGAPSRRHSGDGGRRRKAQLDRRTTPRLPPRRRSVSVPRLRSQLDMGQQCSTSADAAEESDDDDDDDDGDDDEESRAPAPLCQRCMARRARSSTHPVRKAGSLSHTLLCSNCCPLCGAPEPKRTTVRPPVDQSSTQRKAGPLSSTPKEKRGVFLTAAPPPPVLGSVPVLHWVSVCPPVLYSTIPVASSSHPKSLYLPQSEDDGGHRAKVKGHPRRAHSTGVRLGPSTFRNRSVSAVSGTHEVPRRTAPSLSSGQRILNPATRSCWSCVH